MADTQEFLDDLLNKYRSRSDMAYSEVEDGVYTHAEYGRAQKEINGEFTKAILQHFQQEQERARVDGAMKGPNLERIWKTYRGIETSYGEWLGSVLEELPIDNKNLAESLGKRVEDCLPLMEALYSDSNRKKLAENVVSFVGTGQLAEKGKAYTQSEVDRLIREAIRDFKLSPCSSPICSGYCGSGKHEIVEGELKHYAEFWLSKQKEGGVANESTKRT